MTVCIAAVVIEQEDEPTIVLCADTKGSSALGSANNLLKMRYIAPGWRCLVAGSDEDINATLLKLQAQFRLRESQSLTRTEAVDRVRSALIARRREKIEELIQGKYSISFEEFLAKGRTIFTEDLFRATMAEITMVDIGAEFIVAGYPAKYPLLIKTDTKGRAAIKEGFAVIGEGAYLAHASLMARELDYVAPLGRALYCVYEAKKFAEGAPSVGEDTSVFIMTSTGERSVLAEGRKLLHKTYMEIGRKPVPANLTMDKKFLGVTEP